tara:strand:+ start:13681 stop:14655 length:975 start_codon:yes stop_codon:yes gene_type:complete
MRSYDRIDYRIRPAKSIERKMLADSFRRLAEFGPLPRYRYVGLGSLYFSDFTLFHKSLGFERMVSIEDQHDLVTQQRFKLNVPYGHIDMRFGSAGVVLSRLSWEPMSIVWLDYDGALSAACLRDIDYVTRHAAAGSLVIISVNAGDIRKAESDAGGDGEGQTAGDLVDVLRRLVGVDEVPPTVVPRDLSGWGIAKVYREIINEKIARALRVRSGTEGAVSVAYKQLYNFHYSDGVKMLTVGGILHEEDGVDRVERCGFQHLDFLRFDEDSYLIDPPNLTHMEMRRLDADRERADATPLPLRAADIEKYNRSYRYFPTFVEAEFS